MKIGGKNTRQIDAKNIKICIANVNWEKNTSNQCKKYKKFALPMQIGKKKLVKSMQKI